MVIAALDQRPDTRRVDMLIALAYGVLTTVGVWQEIAHASRHQPPALFAYLLGAVAAASLVARRRRPWMAAWVCLAAVAVYHLAGYSGAAPAIASFVAVYSFAAHSQDRCLWQSALIGMATATVVVLPPNRVSLGNGAVYGPALGLVIAAFVGDAMRSRTVEMHRRLDQLDRQRVEEGRRRVAEERIRIARDLHDVIAHTVAVITVQAGLAADALDRRPDETRAALQVIRRSAREATQELRVTVGVLRADRSGHDNRLAPIPGIDDLQQLLSNLPSLTVTVAVTGEDRELSPAVDLAAYRIVQEALTNVVRHAGTSLASIDIRYNHDAVTIEVADSGQGPTVDGHSGFGLIGMQERAATVGGTVTAGPAASGGFRVLANLPRERRP